MTEIIIDLSNYRDKQGSRVEPGLYDVVVEDAETETARSGNKMVLLYLRIRGGSFDGATLMDRLVLTEKSMFRVVGFMQAIGLPTPRKRLSLHLQQFTGKALQVQVEDGEPYNGRIKSEIRQYVRVKTEPAELEDLPSVNANTDTPESGAEPGTDPVDLDSIIL